MAIGWVAAVENDSDPSKVGETEKAEVNKFEEKDEGKNDDDDNDDDNEDDEDDENNKVHYVDREVSFGNILMVRLFNTKLRNQQKICIFITILCQTNIPLRFFSYVEKFEWLYMILGLCLRKCNPNVLSIIGEL